MMIWYGMVSVSGSILYKRGISVSEAALYPWCFIAQNEHKTHLIHTIRYCMEHGYLESKLAKSLIERYKELAERLYETLYKVMQRDFAFKSRNLISAIRDYEDIAKREKVLLVELINGLENDWLLLNMVNFRCMYTHFIDELHVFIII